MKKGLVVALVVVVVLAALLVAVNPRIRCTVTLGRWQTNTFVTPDSTGRFVRHFVGRCNY